jgi:transcription termination/antitermination protein NusG
VSARFAYSIGEMVRIKTGAFQCFTGRVEEVDESHATLKVMVKIFGRLEPIELRFIDVEKIEFTEEQ